MPRPATLGQPRRRQCHGTGHFTGAQISHHKPRDIYNERWSLNHSLNALAGVYCLDAMLPTTTCTVVTSTEHGA